MNKKTVIAALMTLALFLNVTAFEASAFGDRKTKGHNKGIEKKIFCKAYLILKNRDELGLSDKQVKKIKDLKISTKKDLIRKNAEIDVLALDIKAAMHGDRFNTGAINKLIDKKYDLKKEKAKFLVGAYAALRETLTNKQRDKLKGIWKKCKKEMMRCSKMEGKGKYQKMHGKK